MNPAVSYSAALFLALLLHGAVVGLLMVNWSTTEISFADIKPYYIDASIVAENPYIAEKRRDANKEKSQREKTIEQRRKDEAEFLKQQAKWEAERLKIPVVTEVPVIPEPTLKKSEEKSEKPDIEEMRSEFEQNLVVAIREEQGLRRAVTDDEKAMAYVAQIQREIIQNWSRPPSARNGMESILRVFLIPTGEVVDVKVQQSSGNDAFDRSAVLAVRKAERFVVPVDSLRFERDFREFTVLFRPEDLRL